jgi:hypothetical protein
VLAVLQERDRQPQRRAERRTEGIARAAVFSWTRYASEVLPVYLRLAGASAVR